MKLRKAIIALTLVFLVNGLGMVHVASADIIGDSVLTGYNYMGGYGLRVTTPESGGVDYILAQPLTYDLEGYDYWGYAWIKFDNLSETTVNSAYLVLDLLGVGGMSIADASEDYPGILDIYSPGDTDVADLDEDTDEGDDLRETLKDTLLTSTALVADYTMTSNGTYAIDITDTYNAWVTGDLDNNGLVLASDSENSYDSIGCVGAKFAGIGSTAGNTPYISTSAVPVPAAVWLLGSGLVGLIGLRRRKQ
jgi:hypothetical protein